MIDILKRFNWLDVLLLVFFARICIVSFKKGLTCEFFKFLGTLFSIYLSLHYYSFLANLLHGVRFIEAIPLDLLKFICFVLLAVSGYLIFVLLRKVFSKLFHIEDIPSPTNKWAGFLVGALRGVLFASFILYTLFISGSSYLKSSVKGSLLARDLFKAAPFIYSGIWNKVTSKFVADEEINTDVMAATKEMKRRETNGLF